jgi:8-oxo-dGTP pyrophosphatase MutT (NUDIX family)
MGEPMVNPWRTLGTRIVYRDPWITLREDRVIRPDGAEGVYGVVEMPPSCGVVAISDSNDIALVSQWRYVHDKLSLEIPTGGSEKGESPLDAAKRELAEETGLTAESWIALGTVDNSNGSTTDVAHMFMARSLSSGPIVQQGDERVELRWMPFEEAIQAVLTGAITESVSVAAILKTEIMSIRGLHGHPMP